MNVPHSDYLLFVNCVMRVRERLLLIAICFFITSSSAGQTLFSKECFIGGVMCVGLNKDGNGTLGGSCGIHWEESFEVRKIYAVCYRFGRIPPHYVVINGDSIPWNYGSQVGPETIFDNSLAEYYATHVREVTDQVSISGDEIFIDFPPQNLGGNYGWHSAYLIIQYTSPSIVEEVCSEVYIADQRQDQPQDYVFETPSLNENYPLLFSVFGSRITEFFVDRVQVILNNTLLGEIWTPDLVNSSGIGVQGHFYFENLTAQGLNGDTANSTFFRNDAIALVNNLVNLDGVNNLRFISAEYLPNSTSPNQANLIPAFTLTYVPECSSLPDLTEFNREYSYCRGDTVQFSEIDVYDHYSWNTAIGLSDSTSSSPLCFADSSQWYYLSMWDEGEEECKQIIPVNVEVEDNPIPTSITVRESLCPPNTGIVEVIDTPGSQPLTYQLNDAAKNTGLFEDLAPENYDLEITSAFGCMWDTSLVVGVNPIHESSFSASPETGFSPLEVLFDNTSIQATDFDWLIDGIPISQSENLSFTFADSGTYEVSLIAYRLSENCVDTATLILRVEPGLSVLIPNIVTPNADGRNDELIAQIKGLKSGRWVIYDRWGSEKTSGVSTAPFTTGDDEFEKVVLWKPESDVSAGIYQVIFIAEGLSSIIERFSFEVTVVR